MSGDRPWQIGVVRRILIVSTALLTTSAGVWSLVRGRVGQGAALLAFAMVALLALWIPRIVERRGRPKSGDSIVLRADPATAARWADEALRRLAPDEVVDADPTGLHLMIVLPRNWVSWGERVSVVIEPIDGGARVEVRSVGVLPQLVDWGVNRKNVEAVTRRIADLDAGAR